MHFRLLCKLVLVCWLAVSAMSASVATPEAPPTLHSGPSVKTGPVRCIFSDLDGTLCHFQKETEKHGVTTIANAKESTAIVRNKEGEERTCRLLPTSTMGAGTVSDRTVELIGKLRKSGVKFVIITGARSTTMIERMPLLPFVDAVACETGTKIWYPPAEAASDPPNQAEWELDKDWARPFEPVTGPLDTELAAPLRQGTLWDLYREMKAELFDPDARGYTGCFRVRCKTPDAVTRIAEIVNNAAKLDELGIGHAMNLGMYDFFPKIAGKGNTVRYLKEKWGFASEECVALFDDDNDIPMARECAAGYLPSITSESVRSKIGDEKGWTVAKAAGTGVFATEEILEKLLLQVSAEAVVSGASA